MMDLKPLIVLILVSLNGVVLGKKGDKLKAVIVLFNVGDRGPLRSWPNDKYFGNSSLWADGYGQLNNIGKERQFKLGQWLRKRYNGFLNARYNRSDIMVQSTDVDRALMSAECNLAGLYPPSGGQVWNKDIQWQSIPVHTMPTTEDHLLFNRMSCPKFDRLKKDLLNSEEFTELNQKYEKFFQNISAVTGYSTEQMNLSVIATIYNTINIYREYNLTLPSWTNQYWHVISTLATKSYQVDTYTQDMARLRTGKFFDHVFDYINRIRNQTGKPSGIENTGTRKFVLLSGHDFTVSERTNAMGVFQKAVPEFASTVIWELKYRNGNDTDLFLNMYYKNSTALTNMTLPGCKFDCRLEDYARILKPITQTIDQWTKECAEE